MTLIFKIFYRKNITLVLDYLNKTNINMAIKLHEKLFC